MSNISNNGEEKRKGDNNKQKQSPNKEEERQLSLQAQTQSQSQLSCCQKLAALEHLICGFGNLWGILKNSQHLVLWWMFRHGAIYAPIVVLILVYIPVSLWYVIVFFFAAHFYKLGRYLLYSIKEQKMKKKILKGGESRCRNTMNKNGLDGRDCTVKEIQVSGGKEDRFDINA